MTQEKKINIAELLKDCPKGMELDCTLYENLYFDYVREHAIYPIVCYTVDNKGEKISISFNWYGKHTPVDTAKCVIFPKGKTTWEGFHRPFDDGDIVATEHGLFIGIVKVKNNMQVNAYCSINDSGCFGINSTYGFERLATEEEKQKLFKAIKEHGYKWNAETKTLEKLPKFKVGDKIVQKNSACTTILITNVGDEFYYSNTESSVGVLPISEQDDWELVSNKFDINTLVPFDSKVLIRDGNTDKWKPNFWGFYNGNNKNDYPYECCGSPFAQCIPYEGNEHLLGKTDDCEDFYKTWE